jgi:hypothetical protein
MDEPCHVDEAEQHQQEDRDDKGELDQRLATRAPAIAALHNEKPNQSTHQ